MTANIIVKVGRSVLDSIRAGEKTSVSLPMNDHWNRKLKNPWTGRYYRSLRVIVRSYEKDPAYVITATAGSIFSEDGSYTIGLENIHVLLPPFKHQLINETRRNSIR